MEKVFVLDTNVLLHDPNSIFTFGDNEVVIPAVVLEEIDGKKRDDGDIGRNARAVARSLDQLRLQGSLHEGVKLPNTGSLRIEMNHVATTQSVFQKVTNDNRILTVALNLHNEELEKKTGKAVIVVSKDILMRVKADVIGLPAEDYLSGKVIANDDESYSGLANLLVHPAVIDSFYSQRALPVSEIGEGVELFPNQFAILRDTFGSSKSVLGQITSDGKELKPLYRSNDSVWGIAPKNAQQRAAFELLLNDDIKLVTMRGKAGTGKTLLSLAAALSKALDEQRYTKLLVARPVVPMGNDLGYLPGSMDEKLRPWMQPIYDNLEFLFNVKKGESIEKILAGMGDALQVEALTYIRGRSIPKQFIIIDEAQNLSKHEVKTIISRAGEGSKIVLVGDPEQIDHPYLDLYSNGLTYVIEKFKGQPVAGHITLTKGERSELAQLAADLL